MGFLVIFRSALALFLFLCGSNLVNAQSYTSYGARGCGTTISAVDSKNDYEKRLVEISTKSWIGGYVTAYNSWSSAIGKKEDILVSSNIEGAYMSVINYCRANPLQNISDAMVDTIDKLAPPAPSKRR
jgi:hypothetical protein